MRCASCGTTDRSEGLANGAVGNDKLQAEGQVQDLNGVAQETAGEVKDGAEHLADELIGPA